MRRRMFRGPLVPDFLRAVGKGLRDPLYRNALFLMLTFGIGSLAGFLFWLLVARHYTAADVGLAASLVALAGLLGSLATLGMGTGLIRFLPSVGDGQSHIRASLTLASLAALGIGLAFLAGLDLWAPAVAPVLERWWYTLLFLAFTVTFALAYVVDSSFLAARKGSYVLGRSLVYQALRLPLPLIVVALGAFGIFLSFGVALLAALLVGTLFLARLYPGFRPTPSSNLAVLREMIAYSLGNHMASLLYALPAGLLPLLVLHRLSADGAAHFYIAWMVASFLFVVPAASATSLFVEGSHPDTSLAGDTVRSLRFTLLLLLPGILVLLLAGPFLLGLFGPDYIEGGSLLRVLALAVPLVALNATFGSYLRVANRVRELIVLSGVLGAGTVILSYLLMDGFGLLAPGIAFLGLQAIVSGYVLLRNVATSRRVARELVRV